MTRRLERLNGLFREELSDLLLRQVKDPRLAQFVSITRVAISPDLSHARVFVSVMGSEEEKASTLEGPPSGVRPVGHPGTLDPTATGVLVVCLGAATRLSEYVMDLPKAYRAEVRLGG